MFRHRESPSILAIRPRGLAALCASIVVIFALTSCSLSYSSYTCVNGRCNVTVRGDQMFNLSGHDGIRVSNIGSGSATFTVHGDTVTLRVHETKQVGKSIVNLTSVEGDVAKFTIDFTGHFVDKSQLQKQIIDLLEAKTGQRPKAVTCPVGLKAVKGATAQCQLETSDGKTSAATVTVTSVEDDMVKFRFQVNDYQRGGPDEGPV